jgi:hypothetical protein
MAIETVALRRLPFHAPDSGGPLRRLAGPAGFVDPVHTESSAPPKLPAHPNRRAASDDCSNRKDRLNLPVPYRPSAYIDRHDGYGRRRPDTYDSAGRSMFGYGVGVLIDIYT